MKRLLSIILSLTVLCMFLFTGCKKDTEDVMPEKDDTNDDITNEVIEDDNQEILQLPEVRITCLEQDLPYVVAKNHWDNVSYDRRDTLSMFMDDYDEGIEALWNEEVTISFLDIKPEEIYVSLAYIEEVTKGDFINYQLTDVEVNEVGSGQYTFFTENEEDIPEDTIYLGYIIRCTYKADLYEWEYGLVMKNVLEKHVDMDPIAGASAYLGEAYNVNLAPQFIGVDFELLKTYMGDSYETVAEGVEGHAIGYYYKPLHLVFVLDSTSTVVDSIYIEAEGFYNDTSIGMSSMDVIERLGEGEWFEVICEEPTWWLVYTEADYYVEFRFIEDYNSGQLVVEDIIIGKESYALMRENSKETKANELILQLLNYLSEGDLDTANSMLYSKIDASILEASKEVIPRYLNIIYDQDESAVIERVDLHSNQYNWIDTDGNSVSFYYNEGYKESLGTILTECVYAERLINKLIVGLNEENPSKLMMAFPTDGIPMSEVEAQYIIDQYKEEAVLTSLKAEFTGITEQGFTYKLTDGESFNELIHVAYGDGLVSIMDVKGLSKWIQ